MKQADQLVFGGQGPLPMRFGSEGDTFSTGRRSKRGWAGIASACFTEVEGYETDLPGLRE